MLDLKALLAKILNKMDKVHQITSAVSVFQGSVGQINICVFYDSTHIKNICGRAILTGLTVNSRPAITVNVPEDMPSCSVVGASMIRGSGTSIVATDAPIFNHTYGSSTATINMGYTVGTAPAGYATMTF